MKKGNKEVDEEDKLHKLINVKQLSRNLSGNETSIRRDKYPAIYKKAVEELDSAVKRWAKKNPEVELNKRLREPKKEKPFQIKEEKKPSVGKKISQAKVKIERVADEHKKGFFTKLKESVHIFRNDSCYKVERLLSNPIERFEGFFYEIKDAENYLESLNSMERNGSPAGPEYHKYK